MSGSCQFAVNPRKPNSCSIVLPSGRKIKISEEADGRIRFRLVGAGPMAILESSLPGEKKDVTLTVGPALAPVASGARVVKQANGKKASPKKTFVAKELTDIGPLMNRQGVTLRDIAEGRARRKKK